MRVRVCCDGMCARVVVDANENVSDDDRLRFDRESCGDSNTSGKEESRNTKECCAERSNR